jgi:lipoprotein-anchoring transpeptidase ErfK/SrfK
MMVRAPWTAPDGRVYQYGDEGYQLGERWIAFEDQPGASGIGIHGTHDEASIGTMCSNGCLRMKNEDVIELYDFVRNGTEVKIIE